MDAAKNPFSPGAGTQPPELVGRSELLEKARVMLARIKRGQLERSIWLVGLRGTGKTVLLRKIAELAKEEKHQVIMVEAEERESLPVLLIPELRRVLFSLDASGPASKLVKKGLRVLQSFMSRTHMAKATVNMAFVKLEYDVEPEIGVADSGDLKADLSHLLIALGEAAKDRHTAVTIIVDELQYLKEDELSALITAAHTLSQLSLPVLILGAGLPQLVGKAGRAKSYAERLFNYPEIGSLSPKDVRLALQEPVRREGVMFTDEALDEIIRVTQGYPYFIQEWGYQAWSLAETTPIDMEVIKRATEVSNQQLDKNFFRVRFDRLTDREKDYLKALADLGTDIQRSGGVADKLGLDVQQAAPLRNNLIKKGMIYSPRHGETAFTVPLFGEFLKRTMSFKKS